MRRTAATGRLQRVRTWQSQLLARGSMPPVPTDALPVVETDRSVCGRPLGLVKLSLARQAMALRHQSAFPILARQGGVGRTDFTRARLASNHYGQGDSLRRFRPAVARQPPHRRLACGARLRLLSLANSVPNPSTRHGGPCWAARPDGQMRFARAWRVPPGRCVAPRVNLSRPLATGHCRQ
jgi:hypothetical protein